MASSYMHILPILVFLWFPITFVITFTIAVVLGHVNPIFPYISDSGTYSPESCVFGQLINIGSLLFGLVMYVRYRQTRELFHNHNLPSTVQKLNNAAISIGITGVFGVSFVGNFQETNVFAVHIIGAFIGFGFGASYLVLQTLISLKLFPLSGKRWILYTRLMISCICVVTFFLCCLFGVLSVLAFKGKDMNDMTKWSKKDGGWEFHVVSAVNEWLTAFSVMIYVLTFAPEFQKISITEPVIYIEEELIIDPRDTTVA